jgi:hypothetical protein
MPRYFFDLIDDKKIYDKRGVTLPNETAARQYAVTFARELMETKRDLMGESWREWSVRRSPSRNPDGAPSLRLGSSAPGAGAAVHIFERSHAQSLPSKTRIKRITITRPSPPPP